MAKQTIKEYFDNVVFKTVSVTDTATEIITTATFERAKAIIKNVDAANSITLGADDTITAGAGWTLGAGETIELPIGPNTKVYGIAGSGLTVNVEVIELG